MSRKLIDLIGDRAIIQGESWNYEKHTGISFPHGDWRLWTPFGQIRTATKDLTNTLLATFDWGESEYDSELNLTTFYPQLSASDSALLPVTKYQGLGLPSLKNAFVYDIEISLENVVKKGMYGFVQVVGEVTYESD